MRQRTFPVGELRTLWKVHANLDRNLLKDNAWVVFRVLQVFSLEQPVVFSRSFWIAQVACERSRLRTFDNNHERRLGKLSILVDETSSSKCVSCCSLLYRSVVADRSIGGIRQAETLFVERFSRAGDQLSKSSFSVTLKRCSQPSTTKRHLQSRFPASCSKSFLCPSTSPRHPASDPTSCLARNRIQILKQLP